MRILSIAILALSCALSCACAARAGDCPGMLSYTYDAGECTETTGDTTDILIRSGNEAESLQRGIVDRSRGARIVQSGADRSHRGVDYNAYRAVAMRLWVGYNGPPIMPHLLARIYGKTAAQRRMLETRFASDLDRFAADPDVAREGGSQWLPVAREWFAEGLYVAFDGTVSHQARTAHALTVALGNVMTHARVTSLPLKTREAIRELYVIRAVTAAQEFAYAAKRHDAAELAALRREARQGLSGDLGIDPARVGLADLICVAYPMRGSGPGTPGCAAERRMLAGS